MQGLLIRVLKSAYIEMSANGLKGRRAHHRRIAQLREHRRGKPQLFTHLVDHRFWDASSFGEQNALDTRPEQDKRAIESLGINTDRAQEIEVIWGQGEETTCILFTDLPRGSVPLLCHSYLCL